MDAITALWTRVDPATAFAAGLPMSPGEAFPVSRREWLEELHRDLQRELERHPSDGLESAAVRSLIAVVGVRRPYCVLRDAVEWIRALNYRAAVAGPQSASSDAALADGLAASRADLVGATRLERALTRTLAESLLTLATDAGLAATRAEVHDLLQGLSGVPAIGDLPALERWLENECSSVVDAPAHRAMLADGYGFEETSSDMDRIARDELATELALTRDVTARIRKGLPGCPTELEKVARALSAARACPSGVMQSATRQARVALRAFESRLVALTDEQRSVEPEPTPPAMISLTTEGEEYLVDGLTASPRARCFITEKQCGSAYTLANVLYHELAHCWHMLSVARRAANVPRMLRVSNPLGTALLEGIAYHREWEAWELLVDVHDAEYASVFDELGLRRDVAVAEFEFETRYWRVARLLRTLFDARVHSGEQQYVSFVNEQAAATGFAPSRIHAFCAHFLKSPGYAPCYAMGGRKVAALQAEFAGAGITRREFNTRLAAIGMVPPANWRGMVGSLG